MDLSELQGHNESDPVYQRLALGNRVRQYAFLKDIVLSALGSHTPYLSQSVIKALNYHAIACLHTHAGRYRPNKVNVGDPEQGGFVPPEPWRVPTLMEQFVNKINRQWDWYDPVSLGAIVLWRINRIHPFINGNGRTARAACFFVICLKMGGWLGGNPNLPELLRRNRAAYIQALRMADRSGGRDLQDLVNLLHVLLMQQLRSNRPA